MSVPIVKHHMRFLTAYADIWPIVRRRAQIGDSDSGEVAELDRQQRQVIENAKAHLKNVLIIRNHYRLSYDGDAKFRKDENEICRGDIVHWINVWAWTFDPRMPAVGLPALTPFILWPKQEEFIRGIDECMRNKRNWLGEKSRGVGMTWLVSAFYVYHWLFTEGFVGKFASRKVELVDKKGDPDTLFSKLRHIIYHLPVDMRPPGFDKEYNSYDNELRIFNPRKNSSIIGEGGDNIGAGGRSTIAVVDEKALHEHQMLVDRALSQNTDCQGDVSTPRGSSDAFARKRNTKGVKLFTILWWQDPSKNKDFEKNEKPVNNAWYEYQKERFEHDSVIIAQELDCDYNASVEGIFIKPEWVDSAINFPMDEGDEYVAGFDVAGGGTAESVYLLRKGSVVLPVTTYMYQSEIQAAWKVVDLAEKDGATLINYDANGIGHSILALLKDSDRPIRVMINPIFGQSAASESTVDEFGVAGNRRFANKRAEIWWTLRQRFENTYNHKLGLRQYTPDKLISIPNDQTLIKQLTTPKLMYTAGGKIGIEGKKELKKRTTMSLDRADALAYAFAPADGSMVVPNFSYTMESGTVLEFNVNLENGIAKRFVSIYQQKDLSLSALYCMWWPRNEIRLQVCFEFYFPPELPVKTVLDEIKQETKFDVHPVSEWVGNDELFGTKDNWTKAPERFFAREGIAIRKNLEHDERGSIMLLNEMLDNRRVQIHKDCKMTVMQLSQWKRIRGTPTDNMPFAMCLAQLVARLKTMNLLNDEQKEVKSYTGDIEARRRAALKEYLQQGV